ncbi:hydrogenase, Fe-only [Thermoanaerobacter mathranii subsp. mathranii str. A3]|jgi:NADP-reducing hydrogenase subunit HndD|uniref:NADP-reducing hydrogenase subunit HndD n=2 Tax=Thermoanaerobacter TaxID=1754 RepID=A0ABT9M5G5_9THEO|nr:MULTISPECIES: NADH-dependent [FeFe] hydrogenase, group A6 [Thermoanaerobacter]ADH60605.1 hydrogenase, Fe-only [Thermoanaerobacter mathranii subsp. mathranii str. A3]MBT1280385.1 iron hydrogenase small subunit [Thermoanaerobacter sp. CM-CNRG TB177]MDK2814603.1 NADP-reducing hydrogenase subunit HndD [Thermoanaerobacter sp.]MDP9751352.1 NADP-reducing hydrogenase subunit HndD [Thermoanaerobacter pentosaceus]
MDKVRVTIDGITVEVPSHYTVLEAAKEAGIDIPTLCYLKEINQIGACRICVVEIEGVRNLQTSCTYPVFDGMKVYTNTAKIREARKLNLELILSNHDRSCLTCIRNTNCELQSLSKKLGVNEIRFEGENIKYSIDNASPAIVRDPNKCVLCRRCVAVCSEVQNVFAIGMVNRGFKTMVAPSFGRSLKDSPCISCGQCIEVCPVGAIYEKDHTKRVYEALADEKKYVVAQTAPAVRVALGEEFGMPIGSIVTGKMVAALKRMGFDAVFDTDFAADLTIMEEGSELLERLKNGGKLPMITSCSPGWIAFCEKYYPEFIDNLSTCKSPHMMMGALVKSYYAEKEGLNPEDIYVVSIMPCTAKKLEIERPEMQHNGIKDVDAVLTTRELARMIKEMGIDFVNLPDEEYDEPLGMSTGAGVIFGATGGVMEAALRTVADIVEGRELDKVDFEEVRGLEGVREATIKIDGMDIKVAIANGTGNAKKLLDKIKAGEVEYHFIEVMGCPGGCIMGGGQPIHNPNEMGKVKELRAKAIYEADKSLPIRKSHKNPAIQKLYEEFLGSPLSEKSHHLLHTHYSKKELYPLVR